MVVWRKATSVIVASLLLPGAPASYARNSDEKSAAAVDEVFGDLTKSGSPGCALGVYRDGKVVYAKGYGLANVEENVPITRRTLFDVGSVSKQVTAASILLLERQGRLRLDDDVRKYLPELPDYS